MALGSLLALSLGLAMDAVAVSAVRGMVAPRVTRGDAARVAIVFGGMQALMPVGGWLLGVGLGPLIESVDHWIAFGILGLLGAKMIWEALAADEGADPRGGGVAYGRAVSLRAPRWPLLVAALGTPVLGYAAVVLFAVGLR